MPSAGGPAEKNVSTLLSAQRVFKPERRAGAARLRNVPRSCSSQQDERMQKTHGENSKPYPEYRAPDNGAEQ